MKRKIRKPEPCQADNCGAITPNSGTADIQVRLCQKHMRGLATGEMDMKLEIIEHPPDRSAPGEGNG